jgi:hypothetical protein
MRGAKPGIAERGGLRLLPAQTVRTNYLGESCYVNACRTARGARLRGSY